MKSLILFLLFCGVFCSTTFGARSIEDQLAEVGSVPNEEIIVVQRKFTRKEWRHELTPVAFGGIPFGTIRRTLFGSASYTLHPNDWLGIELLNFVYSKTFFTNFVGEINANNVDGSAGFNKVDVNYQKLLYIVHGGLQISPLYGKMATFSRYIAYLEPYIFLGAGVARTEADTYVTFVPGIGLRFFFREWVSMRFELRDFIYQERNLTAAGTGESTWRHNWAVMLSLSFWLPKMPG